MSTSSVSTFLHDLIELGHTYFVVSPGLRNALLLQVLESYDANNLVPNITIDIQIDERSAAFTALAIAKTQQKVVLLCTSGTAPAHYLPAIIEAYYQQIPLLVLTADRQNGEHLAGADQAINQNNLFGVHCPTFMNLSLAESENTWRFVAAYSSLQMDKNKRPLHLNLHLPDFQLATHSPSRRKPYWRIGQGEEGLTSLTLPPESTLIVFGDKGLTPHLSSSFINCLKHFTYLTDLTAPTEIPKPKLHFEMLQKQRQDFLGKITHLVHIGGKIISREFTRFQQAFNGEHILIRSKLESLPSISADLYCVSHLQECLIPSRIGGQIPLFHQESAIIPASQLQLMQDLFQQLSVNDLLILGNSTVIRAADYIASFFPCRPELYCQRGVNGIDGLITQALALSTFYPHRHIVAVLGDVSFFADIGALFHPLREKLPPNFHLIVVNNGGGQIFSTTAASSIQSVVTPHLKTMPQGFSPLPFPLTATALYAQSLWELRLDPKHWSWEKSFFNRGGKNEFSNSMEIAR